MDRSLHNYSSLPHDFKRSSVVYYSKCEGWLFYHPLTLMGPGAYFPLSGCIHMKVEFGCIFLPTWVVLGAFY